jgi:predicted DNA-binding protein YlxM (UPF0122 family)
MIEIKYYTLSDEIGNIFYLRKTINRNKKVLAKNENDELIFTSLTEASKFFNVSKQAILNCISNKVKKSCGYIFSYIL